MLNKMHCIYETCYSITVKRNRLDLCIIIWIVLKNVLLNEESKYQLMPIVVVSVGMCIIRKIITV